MPGSGKSEAAHYLKGMGFRTVEMGESVKSMMKKAGIEATNESIRNFSLYIRKRKGPTVFAVETSKRLRRLGHGKNLCIVGVRSTAEINYFKENHDGLRVIALTAPRSIRFARLVARGRKDDMKDRKGFEFRERREAQFGMRGTIDAADYIITNTGTKAQLKGDITKVVALINRGSGRAR